MKAAAVGFLILIVLLQSSIKTSVIAYYGFQKEFIIANLCENRADPLSTCKGKCFLRKTMALQDNVSGKHFLSLQHLHDFPIFYSAITDFSYLKHYSLIVMGDSHYSLSAKPPLLHTIYHPPKST